MTITVTKPDEPQPSPFACSFCGRAEGDPGIDVIVVGPTTQSGSIACICSMCTAGSASAVRGIRMQRMARMKGKRKARQQEFVPPSGEFSGCRCPGCPEKQTPKRECACCADRRLSDKYPNTEPAL